jgi:hypothetical protein
LQWSLNGNFLSDTTQSITATAGGTYRISYRDSACYSPLSDPFVVTVHAPPAQPVITTTDPTIFCGAASTLLKSSATANNQWYKDGNPIAGATSETYLATTSGDYTVTVTENGCPSAFAYSMQVVANYVPPAPVLTTNSPTTICAGNTILLQANGNGILQWYRNGNLISGVSSTGYVTGTAGVYTVKQTLNGCLSSASAAITVTVTTPTTPVITPGGTIGLCPGDTVKLSSSIATGNQWYNYGTAIPGATGASLVVTNGSFSVRQTSNGCVSAASNTVTVGIYVLPAAPVITQAGTLLMSSLFSGNQWYLNGTIIPGATARTYNATTSGVYTVRGMLGTCIGPVSNAITINLSQSVNVGPNPTHGTVYLSYPQNTSTITVKLLNMYGLVLKQDTFINTYQLDLSALPNGYYIIHMINQQTGWEEQRTVLKL